MHWSLQKPLSAGEGEERASQDDVTEITHHLAAAARFDHTGKRGWFSRKLLRPPVAILLRESQPIRRPTTGVQKG